MLVFANLCCAVTVFLDIYVLLIIVDPDTLLSVCQSLSLHEGLRKSTKAMVKTIYSQQNEKGRRHVEERERNRDDFFFLKKKKNDGLVNNVTLLFTK
jgi:hypothetical protein